MSTESRNPFPGPRPYQADERELFFGREDMAREIAASVLAQRCLTVYGPSGAGKSSIMRAAVIPGLEDTHEIRSVCIEGWPDSQPPLTWLREAMYEQLSLSQPEPESAGELDAAEAVSLAIQQAARRSERLILVYLDQLEQLLYPGRDPGEFKAFIAAVDRLVSKRALFDGAVIAEIDGNRIASEDAGCGSKWRLSCVPGPVIRRESGNENRCSGAPGAVPVPGSRDPQREWEREPVSACPQAGGRGRRGTGAGRGSGSRFP